MAKSLNFNTMKKKYLTVTLPDDGETILMIGMPTKAIMGSLLAMQSSVEMLTEDETDTEALDMMYESCAKIMSRNKMGIPVSQEKLEEIFDFEDILVFFTAYTEFVTEATTQKN